MHLICFLLSATNFACPVLTDVYEIGVNLVIDVGTNIVMKFMTGEKYTHPDA